MFSFWPIIRIYCLSESRVPRSRASQHNRKAEFNEGHFNNDSATHFSAVSGLVELVELGLPKSSDHHPMRNDAALGHNDDTVSNVIILVVHLVRFAGG